MKTAIKTLNELMDRDNKRQCMSALRAVKKCFLCDNYKTCESKIDNLTYNDLIAKKKKTKLTYKREVIVIDNLINML